MLLGARGFLCALAPNALDGIEQAEAGQFDVALVDINMPGLDGFEVIKALVRIEPRMRVVAMSGRQFDGDIDFARDGGKAVIGNDQHVGARQCH